MAMDGNGAKLRLKNCFTACSIKSLFCTGCSYGRCRRALFFLMLEITSFTLDLLGRNRWSFLLAQFLLSAIVFGSTIYVYVINRRNIFTLNSSEAEKQLVGEEVGFAVLQLVVAFICLIIKASYKASLFPLAYAVMSVWFAFRITHEDLPVSDSLPEYVTPPPAAADNDQVIDVQVVDSSHDSVQIRGTNTLRQRGITTAVSGYESASSSLSSFDNRDVDGGKVCPWTGKESSVLVLSVAAAKNRVRRGLPTGIELRYSGKEKPIWALVSLYCKVNGVNRGPSGCRRRWLILASEFRKIKKWESQIGAGDGSRKSFWAMRSNVRRERELPSSFDREVYAAFSGMTMEASPSGIKFDNFR